MNRFKLFIPLIIFIVLAVFLWRGLSLDPNHLPSALIDKPVPAFELPNLYDPDKKITNEQLAGEPYLLNVWATWCPSCRIEHPYLIKLAEQGVKIVGVNYKDSDEPAKQLLQRMGDPYAISVVDQDGHLGLDLGVYGAPETYVVDAKGIIRYRQVGAIDERVWRSTIAPLYNKSAN